MDKSESIPSLASGPRRDSSLSRPLCFVRTRSRISNGRNKSVLLRKSSRTDNSFAYALRLARIASNKCLAPRSCASVNNRCSSQPNKGDFSTVANARLSSGSAKNSRTASKSLTAISDNNLNRSAPAIGMFKFLQALMISWNKSLRFWTRIKKSRGSILRPVQALLTN